MRCKNCGTENDDKRYICENCGSPLYDEEDFNTPVPSQQPQSYNNVNPNNPDNLPPADNNNNSSNNNSNNNDNKLAEKKSIIVIAILVVLLVAIIASVAVVASTKNKNETSTSSTSSTSQTISTKHSTTKKRTTETTTEKETTTETTTTTTTTTTKQQNWSVKLVSHGGGTVDGSGSYKDGDNVTITATPDDGYEFDGWYSNGTKISSTMRYSFTAAEDVSISAVFAPVSTTEAPIEEMDGGMD